MADFSGVLKVWDDKKNGGTYSETVNGVVVFERSYNQTELDEAAARRRDDSRQQNRDALLAAISEGIEDLLTQQTAIKNAFTNTPDAQLTTAAAVRQILQWQYKLGDKLIGLARIVSNSVDSTRTT